jgi:protein-tyrosine-phosphatase
MSFAFENPLSHKISDADKVSDLIQVRIVADPIDSTTKILTQNIFQKNSLPFTTENPKMFEAKDITSAGLIICFEKETFEKLQKDLKGANQISIQLLGNYHPWGPLDIPDPIHFSDPNGYEKCFTMCQQSLYTGTSYKAD